MLGASVVGSLRGLIETRSGVEAALKSADDELSEARLRLDEAEGRLKEAGGRAEAGHGTVVHVSSLATTVATLRADDHAARHRLATKVSAAHHQTLADRIRELRPWDGDVQQLVEMIVPEASSIERWKSAASDAQKQVDQHQGEVERLTTERIRPQG